MINAFCRACRQFCFERACSEEHIRQSYRSNCVLGNYVFRVLRLNRICKDGEFGYRKRPLRAWEDTTWTAHGRCALGGFRPKSSNARRSPAEKGQSEGSKP